MIEFKTMNTSESRERSDLIDEAGRQFILRMSSKYCETLVLS